jgi:hypothetical protein
LAVAGLIISVIEALNHCANTSETLTRRAGRGEAGRGMTGRHTAQMQCATWRLDTGHSRRAGANQ